MLILVDYSVMVGNNFAIFAELFCDHFISSEAVLIRSSNLHVLKEKADLHV